MGTQSDIFTTMNTHFQIVCYIILLCYYIRERILLTFVIFSALLNWTRFSRGGGGGQRWLTNTSTKQSLQVPPLFALFSSIIAPLKIL